MLIRSTLAPSIISMLQVLMVAYVSSFSTFLNKFLSHYRYRKNKRLLLTYESLQKKNSLFLVYSKELNWDQKRKFYQKPSKLFHIIADTTQLTS